MYDDPGLEQRLSRFEAQLDRFSLALHQWQAREQSPPTAPPDVSQRIRTLEETLDREALALRRMHEEPLKQLQAQAESLRELCAAATTSVSGLDQAEARLAELQNNVSILVTDLSRTLQALVTEMRAGAESTQVAPQRSAAAWPLERVVHLHDELRRAGNGGNAVAMAAAERRSRVFHAVADEPAETSGIFEGRFTSPQWKYVAGISAAIVLVLLTFVAGRWIESRLDDAAARVVSAERQVAATTKLANQEVAAARQNADRQIADARQAAQRAEGVANILAAPDLIRFNLYSVGEGTSSAQLLWSRTRGLVLSGSRLPMLPPESTYQLWLVTAAQPIGVGLFGPDAAGRATFVVDNPPKVPGPVIGASVTIEPVGGRPAPTGRTLLARYPG
jgi:Anti-sigma-K factor rskA